MQSRSGLVVVPSTLPPTTSGLGYVGGSVGSPLCLAATMFAGCLGLGYAGTLGAAIAVLVVVVLAVTAARLRRVRCYLDAQALDRARTRRELQRLRLLRPSGAARLRQYGELRTLVEEVERIDAAE